MDKPGLLVPPLTPFTEEGTVDFRILAEEVDYILETSRPEMIIAAGVETQEYHYLSPQARQDLIRATIDSVDGRCPVAVGITHPSLGEVLRLADLASDLGAAAVQLLAPQRPFGGQPTIGELVAYFDHVAARVDLPMVLYLNPGPGAEVSVTGTIELSSIEKVRYVKESSRDLSRVGLLIGEIDRAGSARYYTTMQMLLASIQLGGSGATMPPPAAELASRVIDAYVEKDWPEAARLQIQFGRFPALWMGHGLAPVMKAAMKCLNRDVGPPHPPFPGLDGHELSALCNELSTMDLARKE